MRTKLVLIVLGFGALLAVEVAYSLVLQKYDTGSASQSFFKGPFSAPFRYAEDRSTRANSFGR